MEYSHNPAPYREEFRMYCNRKEVKDVITKAPFPERRRHQNEIIDLVWIASIVYEFSFQALEQTRSELKEKLFSMIMNRSMHCGTKKERLDPTDFDSIVTYLDQDHELEQVDLCIMSRLFHVMVNSEKHMTKEALREWYDDAWQHGTRQRHILNEHEDWLTFSLKIDVFAHFWGLLNSGGATRGLISK